MLHQGFIHATRFDAPGERVYSVSVEGNANVWDAATGELLESIQLHDGPVYDLSIRGRFLATAGHDGRACVLDVDSLETITVLLSVDGSCHAVLAGSEFVYLGDGSGHLSAYRYDGQKVSSTKVHEDAVICLAALGDGRIVSGSRDRTVSSLDPEDPNSAARFRGHTDWVTKVAPIADRQTLSVDEEGKIFLFDWSDQRVRLSLDLQTPIWGLGMLPDGTEAIIGAAGPVRRLDLCSGALRHLPPIGGFAARGISVHPSGSLAALGHDGGDVVLMDLRDESIRHRCRGESAGILSGSLSPFGWVSGHMNGTLRLAREGTDQLGGKRLEAHSFFAYCMTMVDETRLVSGSLDHSICLWDLEKGQLLRNLDHGGQVFSVRPLKGSRRGAPSMCLSAGDDQIRLWDLDEGSEIWHREGLGSGNHTMAAMTDDGTLACVIGEDNLARLVRREASAITTLELPWAQACAIDFVPGAQIVAIAFNCGAVGTLDLASGAFQLLHKEHDNWVRMLKVSGDGRRILSVSQNGIGLHHDLEKNETTKIGDYPVAAADFANTGAIRWLDFLGRHHP